jgi:hypothetical protein
MTAVWKVRELILLLWVGTLWKCGDILFFQSTSLGKRCNSYNATPTSRKRAADRWSLRNFLSRSSLIIVGKAQKSHGARYELNSVFDLEKLDWWNPNRTSVIQSKSRSLRFLGFSDQEKVAPRLEISKWSTVCSIFSRSGWSVIRSALLAKWYTSKKRPSPHLHKVPTRSNKASSRTFQTALVYWISTCGQPTRGGPPDFEFDGGITSPHRKKDNLLRNVTQGLDSKWGPVVGSCERGNETAGSINGGEVPDWLNDCWLLKKDSAPWSYLYSLSIRNTFSFVQKETNVLLAQNRSRMLLYLSVHQIQSLYVFGTVKLKTAYVETKLFCCKCNLFIIKSLFRQTG